ncbi:unnamed protein product [Protopolystoma xenopodis]|uniref:Uncharacterized protein n=1 Tax=Protopolystoma xenopodis TaxID=117903 RepID=A0A3S5BEV0_9PLAT|nr:unnamed protein product [Protopolystoma xenopodis]
MLPSRWCQAHSFMAYTAASTLFLVCRPAIWAYPTLPSNSAPLLSAKLIVSLALLHFFFPSLRLSPFLISSLLCIASFRLLFSSLLRALPSFVSVLKAVTTLPAREWAGMQSDAWRNAWTGSYQMTCPLILARIDKRESRSPARVAGCNLVPFAWAADHSADLTF